MRKVSVALVVALSLLAGCERPAPAGGAKGIDADNPLEVAARERGVVRPEAPTPVGVFERSHELGRDAMCVVPDGTGQWRFAVTAAFGPGLSCSARGTMTREGAGWQMRFAEAEGCEALVKEEEDELYLPGSLPERCNRLCPARASLAGLRLPRASWSESDARGLRMTDRRGNIGRPCSS